MSDLSSLRGDLTDVLAGTGTDAFDHLPPNLQPPAYLVEPAEPYLTGGETFGAWEARYLVHVVAGPAQADVATDALDAMIAAALAVIADSDRWAADEVSAPQLVRLPDARVHWGADITAITDTHL